MEAPGSGEQSVFLLNRSYDLQGNLVGTTAGLGGRADLIGLEHKLIPGTVVVRGVSAVNSAGTYSLVSGLRFGAEGDLIEARVGVLYSLSVCWKPGAGLHTGFSLAQGAPLGCPSQPSSVAVAGGVGDVDGVGDGGDGGGDGSLGVVSGSWGYDADDLPVATDLNGFGRQQWNRYRLDIQGRLVGVSSSLGDIDYIYSPSGRIVQVRRSGSLWQVAQALASVILHVGSLMNWFHFIAGMKLKTRGRCINSWVLSI